MVSSVQSSAVSRRVSASGRSCHPLGLGQSLFRKGCETQRNRSRPANSKGRTNSRRLLAHRAGASWTLALPAFVLHPQIRRAFAAETCQWRILALNLRIIPARPAKATSDTACYFSAAMTAILDDEHRFSDHFLLPFRHAQSILHQTRQDLSCTLSWQQLPIADR